MLTGSIMAVEYSPMLPWKRRMEAAGFQKSGLDFVFSMCVGIFVCATLYMLIFGGWKRLSQRPLHKSVLRPPLLAGVLWSVANSCQCYSTIVLPYAVAYCLCCAGGLGVTLLWGIFRFHEVVSAYNKRCVGLTFLCVVTGIVLLGLAA